MLLILCLFIGVVEAQCVNTTSPSPTEDGAIPAIIGACAVIVMIAIVMMASYIIERINTKNEVVENPV